MGFTLLETLVYVTLFSLIVVGVFSSIAMIQESSSRSQSEALLIEEASFIGDRLQMQLETSGVGSVPTTDSSMQVTRTSFVSSSSLDNPSHTDFSFILESVTTPNLEPIVVNRTAYLTP